MAERGKLAISAASAFVAWAESIGCTSEAPTNPYEAVRLRLPEALRRPGRSSVFSAYRRDNPNSGGNPTRHLAVKDDQLWLVHRWFRERDNTGGST